MLNAYKADLHIHTVLSPCGDLEMSPTAIVERALSRGLDMIAISDHNTTRQVKVAQKIGKAKGLFVLGGVEVTSQEETHCLCYFPDDAALDAFQEFLDAHLPPIPNDEDRFGYQLIVRTARPQGRWLGDKRPHHARRDGEEVRIPKALQLHY